MTVLKYFLDTNKDRDTYFQFITNTIGTCFDQKLGFSGTEGGVHWNGQWKSAAKVYNNKWTIEIAIPFKSLGLETPKNGASWYVNLARERWAGKHENSTWAPVVGNFHNPSFFWNCNLYRTIMFQELES